MNRTTFPDESWRELKARMDERQAAYRRCWLRAPVGVPAEGETWDSDLEAKLELACELYLRGNKELRREIRDSFERCTTLWGCLLWQIDVAVRKLSRSGNPHWLRMGLAASIDDNTTDFRDTYLALGSLYLNAA